MSQVEEHQLVDQFEQFYRNYYRDQIGDLAQNYPTDQRSLHINWTDLYRYDPDLADDYLAQPDQLREYAEEALRLYDLPIDVSLGQAHIRVYDLPEITEIRNIRAENVNTLVSIQGIVRKATAVRPKIEDAAFECQRCGTLTFIPQTTGFQEPHECQGCERQGPFAINYDQSTFIDAQKLRIQESPEGLRGGETPQSIDVHIEDDITGNATPGDHVTMTGVLRIEQETTGNEKTRMFDIFMEGHSLVLEDQQFENLEITAADETQIKTLATDPDIYDQMTDSIAPSIYGFDETKLAMALQLFSGVTKHLPDESRIRGDMHILLIGDPGTGKCLRGNTKLTLSDGRKVAIREFVESNLNDPKPVDDGVYDEIDVSLPSMAPDGKITRRRAVRVWKREAPKEMLRIRTASGKELETTSSHPLFVRDDYGFTAVRADELKEGEFIATPRMIQTEGNDTLDIQFRRSKANNCVRFDPPSHWTPSLARLIGYIIAEGWCTIRGDHTGDVRITNNDREILSDIKNALSELSLNYAIDGPRDGKSAKTIRCAAGEFASFLESLDPAILKGSADQRVPDAILGATNDTKREFIRAYVDAEGHVSSTQRELTVSSMSQALLNGIMSLLLSFGIRTSIKRRKNDSYRLRVSGSSFQTFAEEIGFVTSRKEKAAQRFADAPTNTNRDIIPNVGKCLRHIREALGLSQSDCGVPRSTYQHYERGDRNPSCENLLTVIEVFEDRLENLHELRQSLEENWPSITQARNQLNVSQKMIADWAEVCQRTISLHERGELVADGGYAKEARNVLFERIDNGLAMIDDVQSLKTLAESDIQWDRIESIETVPAEDDWVYDLEVNGTHSYIANDIISHNSQLLQYIRNIAPRSVYTSGKGSSTAGLTAAAVRDDFGDGQQWSLEAGALVLADKGVAAVDELDKMNPDDRSAMHEALEQQSISISKAGINATLKARCSLLGAANPKYGRFDQYEPIGEQIDLEPALVSRFDLIFTVTDQPDEEEDRALAEHILSTNFSGELSTQRREVPSTSVSEEEVDDSERSVQPAIDPELFRKYIAFAKRKCFPVMTKEAREVIRDFYVDLRSRGTEEDAPVPITARKLEALVRLAEASARVRLSDVVEKEDADRVVEIVRLSLADIGVDPETGRFDADVIETGTSKTQRDRIKTIRTLIADIEDEFDDGAPVDEVLARAEEIGIEESKARHEIEKLRTRGEVYEPTTNHLRTT